MTYLASTIYINKLYQEQYPMIALGQDNTFDNIIDGVKDAFRSFVDPKHSMLANFFSFIGPGILFNLGFPWMAVAYEVAEALGFDWAGIWDSIKNSIVGIFSRSSNGEKPTREELLKKLDEETQDSISKNVSDTVDEKKLEDAQKKSQNEPMPHRTGSTSTFQLIKKAGLFRSAARSRGLLVRLFRKIIPWALTTLAVSLGFAVAGGAASGALGVKRAPSGDKSEEDPSETGGPASEVREPIYNLQMSQSADPSLFEFNKNDASSVWLETGNIKNITNILMGWILSAFPDLEKNKEQLKNSNSFIKVENMFKDRNKLAQELSIYSVPKPFQKKIDVVSYIVNSYLKSQKVDV